MFSSLVRTCSLAFEAISEVKASLSHYGLRFHCARLLPQLAPLVQAHCFCPRLPTLCCWPSTAGSYPMASHLVCLSLWHLSSDHLTAACTHQIYSPLQLHAAQRGHPLASLVLTFEHVPASPISPSQLQFPLIIFYKAVPLSLSIPQGDIYVVIPFPLEDLWVASQSS